LSNIRFLSLWATRNAYTWPDFRWKANRIILDEIARLDRKKEILWPDSD